MEIGGLFDHTVITAISSEQSLRLNEFLFWRILRFRPPLYLNAEPSKEGWIDCFVPELLTPQGIIDL